MRKARPGDLEGILAIERESFPDPWPREVMEGYLSSGISLVYEKKGEIVGYLVAIPAWSPLTGRFLHLLNLAVKGSERGKRIAHALLGELIGFARENGYRRILLEVRKDNLAALRLYRRFGFVEKAVLVGFYRDGSDAYLMELELTARGSRPGPSRRCGQAS